MFLVNQYFNIPLILSRLELAYKDAVKKNALYSSAMTLMMGVYYFYRNSPKQRQCLRTAFATLQMKCIVPTRVGGTRWVGHLFRAIDAFFKGYPAIVMQMADLVQQKGTGKVCMKCSEILDELNLQIMY